MCTVYSLALKACDRSMHIYYVYNWTSLKGQVHIYVYTQGTKDIIVTYICTVDSQTTVDLSTKDTAKGPIKDMYLPYTCSFNTFRTTKIGQLFYKGQISWIYIIVTNMSLFRRFHYTVLFVYCIHAYIVMFILLTVLSTV